MLRFLASQSKELLFCVLFSCYVLRGCGVLSPECLFDSSQSSTILELRLSGVNVCVRLNVGLERNSFAFQKSRYRLLAM